MEYDLKNERDQEMRFSAQGWTLALEIAERHGWNPQGTLAPDDWEGDEWEGEYFTREGQRVSREDAARLAAALERALADPHFAAKTRTTFNDLQDETAAGNAKYKRVEYSLQEAGEFGETLRELIGLARGGGFLIK